MIYNISKELFEAVMDEKVTTEISISLYYNEINGCEENDLILINYNFVWIPLNTFFFKCKEWAFNNRYLIHTSWILSEKNYGKIVLEVKHFYRAELDRKARERFGYHHKEYFDTEQQACFDACQYILDKKDKQ